MENGRESLANNNVVQRVRVDVKEWQRTGIITEDQAVAILAYYSDYLPSGRPQIYGRMSTILALMGAVLVGVGILLFVGANWQAIPLVARFALLCTTVIACNGIGYFLLYSRGYSRLGEAVFLLGGIAFGAGIFLGAQVYSYDIEAPPLVLWWSAGVIPIAYIAKLRSLMYLGLGLFVIAFIWFMAIRDSDVESATAFAAVVVALGSSLFAVGTLHRLVGGIFIRFSWIYAGFGTALVIVTLYLLSFEDFLDSDFRDLVNENYLWNFGPIAFLSLLSLLCWIPFLVRADGENVLRRIAILDAVTILGGIAVATIAYWSGLIGNSVIFAAIFNLSLIGYIITIIVAGVTERKNYFINLGLLFFGLLVITRYVDLMWGMLDGALLFITAGVLLLLVGFFLERTRRRLTGELALRDGLHG